jgi:acetolactate synthase-1/2/3 large subunit
VKASDFIIHWLADRGITAAFGVTGGVIANVIDSFRVRPEMRFICTQHEQAAGLAADGYARATDGFGVAIATSGPGATNLVTAVASSWFDSIPTMSITGNVSTNMERGNRGVRQYGFQEMDIVSIVSSITKYAVQVNDPWRIRYELGKAYHMMLSHRRGPVLLDFPMDMQKAEIEPARAEGFIPPRQAIPDIDADVGLTRRMLEISERPVLILGNGIRMADAIRDAILFAERNALPTLPSWAGLDLMPHDHPNFVGQFGVYGNRAANYAVQNADLIISVGCRLDTRMTGPEPKTFARNAMKVVVDIDPAEIGKSFTPTLSIVADAGQFLRAMNARVAVRKARKEWWRRIATWKQMYDGALREFPTELPYGANPYEVLSAISRVVPEDAILIGEAGCNLCWAVQSLSLRAGQRFFSDMGFSGMGYSFPAAIGVAAATNRPVICIAGDGGFQMMINELQTVKHYGLPVKVLLLNNHIYGLIVQFQEETLEGRTAASVPEGGYSTPDFGAVARAYGIETAKVYRNSDPVGPFLRMLEYPGPYLLDVHINPAARVLPKPLGRPIEDQYPFLDRAEFRRNMIVPPVEPQ